MRRSLIGALVVCFYGFLATPLRAQGLFLPGAGAKSRSFGGATTAAPLDAAGGLYWNPATISRLRNEVMFGGELDYATSHLSATIPAGSIGPFPPTTRSGSTRSDSGVAVLPAVAMVYRQCEESPLTFGMGLLAPAGGGVNFAGGPDTPVLTPQNPPGGGNVPPFTFGFGPQAASLVLFNMTPTVAYKLNEQLSVGATMIVDVMTMSIDPAFFATRNGNGTFPAATHGRPYWGAGFKIGALYSPAEEWDFGLAYHSPHWMETLVWNSSDENGVAQTLRLPFTLPSIISMGAAYKGIPNTLLAVDVRWFDYTNAQTLGDSVIEGGVAWHNVWSVALGAQYQVTPALSVRIGYTFSENPVNETLTLFNTQLPGFWQHMLGFGATMALSEKVSASIAYVHTFENTISGSIIQIPGTRVSSDLAVDALAFSINVNY
jgi:long-chain fatty acid transport protein